MQKKNELYRDNVIDLTAILWRLKKHKQFWGRNGAIRFSRFITRFVKKLDEAKALHIRVEVYLDASLRAREEEKRILGWWDAWRAKQYAERLQDYCGLLNMTPEHLETCVSVYRNMGRKRRALGFVREALDRKSVMHSQGIKFLIDGAEILDSLDRSVDAEDFYMQAFGMGPEGYLDKMRLFRSYGAYQLRRGDKDGARVSLEKALRTARENNADTWEKDIQALLAQI